MVASAPQTMWVRDIGSKVNDAKTTFSSWDNCMAKTYCKWPVIAVIVVVSLIIISIVACVVRCCCCGLECCCGCFRCCNACCPGPRGGHKKSKYADGPPPGFQPPPYQGYQQQPAPSYTPARSYNEPARFATFDTPSSKKGPGTNVVNDDALPAMPSWDQASSRRIEHTDPPEEVEMGVLHPHEEKAPMLAYQASPPTYNNSARNHGVVAATSPYQAGLTQNGSDMGSPYGHNNNGTAPLLHESAADMHQPYSSQAMGYGQQRSPYGTQQSAYGVSNAEGTQNYEPTSYGVVGYGHSSPPSQTGSYGQIGGEQYGYSQQTTHVMAPSQVAISQMSPQYQGYEVSSPPAQGGDIPASLVPARGTTPQSSQQQGFQSYNAYGPSEHSTAYTAYEPSGIPHAVGAGLPPMRRPDQQHSDSWRGV